MDTKKLRQKILDLAIRGKLVPQDPNDEPASVLLERIRAEKERLIKEGKIKRSKKSASDTPHYENVPFEVPEGWCWTTIDELLINRDGERKPVSSAIRKKQSSKIYDYYGAAGVIDKVEDYLFNERLLLIGEDGANLLSRSKDNAFFADGKYWVNNHAHVLDATDKTILDMVALVVNSMNLDNYITGSAQPKLSQDNLNKIPIPLPPLSEQHRIIGAAKMWQEIVAALETDIHSLSLSIQQTKSKILDLAIHGKLVPQDPKDEPASELLKRINPDAKIASDNRHYENVPFDLPYNWAWTSIEGINKFRSRSINPLNFSGEMFELYSVPSFDSRHPEFTNGEDIASNKVEVANDDILLCKINPHLNRVWIVGNHGESFRKLASSEWIVIRTSKDITPQYLSLCLQSQYFRELMLSNVSGVGGSLMRAQPNAVKKYLIPIPPKCEQVRIVEAVDAILKKIDEIASTLS